MICTDDGVDRGVPTTVQSEEFLQGFQALESVSKFVWLDPTPVTSMFFSLVGKGIS